LLIVGTGFPQLGLLRFCRAEGLSVIGLDLNPDSVGRVECDEFFTASTTDSEAIARAARELRADGITTCGSDHAVIPTALAAEALGLPFYVPSRVVRACIHKDDMRDLYARGGAPSPAHRNVQTVAEALVMLERYGLPLVVKPARGWGQRGVRVVMAAEELTQAVSDALAAAAQAMPEPRCVVEQFIEGREFSVDAYTRDGETEVLAITERIITSYPDPPGITFAEAHPPLVPDAERERIIEAAVKGVRALGVQRGPTYTQLRSGPKGAFIVETALRLGGGLDPDVTFLASGVSLYRKIVGVALGRTDWERAGREGPAHGGAVGRFIIGKPGEVRAILGLEEARRLPGIVSAEVYVSVGGTVHPLTDGSKRAGHVLAFGADREDAERNARRAMDTIQIVTESVDGGA
jgi:biotin carboxylase